MNLNELMMHFKSFPQVTLDDLACVTRMQTIPAHQQTVDEKILLPMFQTFTSQLKQEKKQFDTLYNLLLHIDIPDDPTRLSDLHAFAIEIWTDYLLAQFAEEKIPLAVLSDCDAELDHPVQFSALLLTLFKRELDANTVMASGLLHRFAVRNYHDIETIKRTYALLAHVGAKSHQVRVILTMASTHSMTSTQQATRLFSNTTLTGQQLQQGNQAALKVYLIHSALFNYTKTSENWKNLHALFGFQWVALTLKHAETGSEIIRDTLSHMSNDALVTLYRQINTQTATEIKSQLLEQLSCLLEPDQIRSLLALHTEFSWFLLKSNPTLLSTLNTEDYVNNLLQNTPISALSITPIANLCRQPSFSPHRKQVHRRMLDVMFTDPANTISDEQLIQNLRSYSDTQIWCYEQDAVLYASLRSAAAQTLDHTSVVNLRDTYRTIKPKIDLICRLSQDKLHVPLTEHELHALMFEQVMIGKDVRVDIIDFLSLIVSDNPTCRMHEQLSIQRRVLLECLVWTHNPIFQSTLQCMLTEEFDCSVKPALAMGHFSLLEQAFINGNEPLISTLLAKNDPADLNLMLKRLFSMPSLMSAFIGNIQAITLFFGALPENERLNALKRINEHGSSMLHLTVRKLASLKTILACLLKTEVLAALQITNKQGNTIMHHAAVDLELLNIVLPALPKSDLLTAFGLLNGDGNTILHVAAKTRGALKIIFAALLREELVAAISFTNQEGVTVAHAAAYDSEALNVMLTPLSKEDCFTVLRRTNKYDETAFHIAKYHSKSLSVMLAILLEKDRLAILKLVNGDNETVFHLTADFPESLGVMLAALPEKDRIAALRLTNRTGTVLHCITQFPESLQVVMDNFPPNQWVTLIGSATHECPIFKCMATNPVLKKAYYYVACELYLKSLSSMPNDPLSQRKTDIIQAAKAILLNTVLFSTPERFERFAQKLREPMSTTDARMVLTVQQYEARLTSILRSIIPGTFQRRSSRFFDDQAMHGEKLIGLIDNSPPEVPVPR